MARYHFNLFDGVPILDEDGFDFSSFEEVRSQAIHFLGAALIDAREHVFKDGQWRLDVTDEAKSVLFSVHILAFDAAAAGLAHLHPGQFGLPAVAAAA